MGLYIPLLQLGATTLVRGLRYHADIEPLHKIQTWARIYANFGAMDLENREI